MFYIFNTEIIKMPANLPEIIEGKMELCLIWTFLENCKFPFLLICKLKNLLNFVEIVYNQKTKVDFLVELILKNYHKIEVPHSIFVLTGSLAMKSNFLNVFSKSKCTI